MNFAINGFSGCNSNQSLCPFARVFRITVCVLAFQAWGLSQDLDYGPSETGPGASAGEKPAAPAEPALWADAADEPLEIQKVEHWGEDGVLITLPRLSKIEIVELLEGLSMDFRTGKGYALAEPSLVARIPPPPEGMIQSHVLNKTIEGGQRICILGYRLYLTQFPRLWIRSYDLKGNQVSKSPDLEASAGAVQRMLDSLSQMRSGLTIVDLETQLVQLSYTNPDGALAVLKGLGASTFSDISAIPRKIPFSRLPLVVKMPEATAEQIGVVGGPLARSNAGANMYGGMGDGYGGGGIQGGGGFGGFGGGGGGSLGLSQVPSVASPLTHETVTTPMSQLLILFHPGHPKQFSRVLQILEEVVDRPARQIFVEGMVLEINKDGLTDLGAKWQFVKGDVDVTVGSLEAGSSADTFGLSRNFKTFSEGSTDGNDSTSDSGAFGSSFSQAVIAGTTTATAGFLPDGKSNFRLQLRALLRAGKAEILSRPSVLTLNNRQATIRVGDDIPIATSSQGSQGSFSLNFQYIPTGILLNIRPRIVAGGSEVSMLIDTTVSATVPGRDLIVRDEQGNQLASAPQISTRRVQTYARIPNNTPLIIGGLISKDTSSVKDKIPLLGDIPLLGALFRSKKENTSKREVIIVLTPYVVPETQHVGRSLPKDEDLFDSFGNNLFRDVYRIRDQDTFDLSFLIENRRLQTYMHLAEELMRNNVRLADQEPFKRFAGGQIPGEKILVHRMMYELIKRLKLDKKVEVKQVILFREQQVGGFKVSFLEAILRDFAKGKDYKEFFKTQKGKALALKYHYDRDLLKAGRLVSEPVPEITVVDCPDKKAWERMLWEMNQPAAEGEQEFTILIHQADDLDRLLRAVILKHIIKLNGGENEVSLRNFSVGKVLLVPEFEKQQILVIDADVARYYYQVEHYYPAVTQRIESTLNAMAEALKRPEIRAYLDESRIPSEER